MSDNTQLDCNTLIADKEQAVKETMGDKAVHLLSTVASDLANNRAQQMAIGIQLAIDVIIKNLVRKIMTRFLAKVAVQLAGKAVMMGVEAVNVIGWAGMAVDAWDAMLGEKFTLFATRGSVDDFFKEILQSIDATFTPDFMTCMMNTLKSVYTQYKLTPPSDEELLAKIKAETALYRKTNEIPKDMDIFRGQKWASCDMTKDGCISDCSPEQDGESVKMPGEKCDANFTRWFKEATEDECNKTAAREAANNYRLQKGLEAVLDHSFLPPSTPASTDSSTTESSSADSTSTSDIAVDTTLNDDASTPEGFKLLDAKKKQYYTVIIILFLLTAVFMSIKKLRKFALVPVIGVVIISGYMLYKLNKPETFASSSSKCTTDTSNFDALSCLIDSYYKKNMDRCISSGVVAPQSKVIRKQQNNTCITYIPRTKALMYAPCSGQPNQQFVQKGGYLKTMMTDQCITAAGEGKLELGSCDSNNGIYWDESNNLQLYNKQSNSNACINEAENNEAKLGNNCSWHEVAPAYMYGFKLKTPTEVVRNV